MDIVGAILIAAVVLFLAGSIPDDRPKEIERMQLKLQRYLQ